ncbi:putative DNA invertase [Xenorhabdus budapestensis]|uniref:Putative DNA invertase n=1 Tax=Xenorhabdus budapestensis TaxID=290110 RepID=A0A2D0J2Y2_XENBU|nr:putative DNA invertase [Xenorhabdus budapestensis]
MEKAITEHFLFGKRFFNDSLNRIRVNLTIDLKQRGISLVFLKENIHFSASESNPLQELQLHMMSVFSQFERALIRERQAEGIAAKKGRGEKTGRPPADKRKVAMVDELKSKGIRLKLACDNVGIGVSTYYKLRKR